MKLVSMVVFRKVIMVFIMKVSREMMGIVFSLVCLIWVIMLVKC